MTLHPYTKSSGAKKGSDKMACKPKKAKPTKKAGKKKPC